MEIRIQDLMIESGVKFGTSGARGLAEDMTDFVCYVYTRGFLQYLGTTGKLNKSGTEVAIAGDLRPSTDRIIQACRQAAADMGCTPVSCNTAVEKCGYFRSVRRTRIGSPFVISSMIDATNAGAKTVVGYEANGGFLTNSDISLSGRKLRALPTRDAVILLLSTILLASREGKKLSELTADLPARHTASDRLKDFRQEDSRAILALFDSGDDADDKAKASEIFGELCGGCCRIDRTDGARMTFDNDEIIHLRPSGNAPEFRCYNEAATENRAPSLMTPA